MRVFFLLALSFLYFGVLGDDDDNWKNDSKEYHDLPLDKESPLPNYKEYEGKLDIPTSGSFNVFENLSTTAKPFQAMNKRLTRVNTRPTFVDIMWQVRNKYPFSLRDVFQGQEKETISNCGRNMAEPHGTLRSPGYPDMVKSDQNCQWHITTSPGEKIFLNITDTQTYLEDDCEHNFLEIRDGFGHKSNILGTVCGIDDEPTTYLTSGHRMLVNFRTSRYHKGLKMFSAEFEAVCGGEIYEQSGEIQSSDYPGFYKPNKTCTWTISGPSTSHIALTINFFELEYQENCEYDYLEVRDGASSDSKLIGKFCGHRIPKEIHSRGNSIFIKFSSDQTIEKSGFSMVFNTDVDECEEGTHKCERQCVNTVGGYYCLCPPGFQLQTNGRTCQAICGGTLTDNADLWTPYYPAHYPPNMNCVWNVSFSKPYQVLLKFHQFKIETEKNCESDYVEVRSGTEETSISLGKFCGHRNPDMVLSYSSNMLIKFVSDSSVETNGFLASVVKEVDECLRSDHGCEQECVNTLGGYHCECRAGYRLQLDNRTCEAICGGNVVGSAGEITSVNVSEEYKECVWKVAVPDHHAIRLRLHDFMMPDMVNETTYLEVRDGWNQGSNDGPLLARSQGKEIEEYIYSNGSALTVKLIPPSSNVSFTFVASFSQAICGGNMNDSGSIQFSTSAGLDYNKIECVWRITTEAPKMVALKILKFQVSDPDDCERNYLYIRKSILLNHNAGDKVCVNETSPDNYIVCSSNEVLVKMVSTGDTHFVAEYEQDTNECHSTDHGCSYSCVNTVPGYYCECPLEFELEPNERTCKALCGGNLSQDEGQLTIPTVTETDFPNIECMWNITVNDSYQVGVELISLQLDEDCENNYLELMYGTNSSNLQKICGPINKTETVMSTNNNILVKFVTNNTSTIPLFSGKFAKGCGGKLEAQLSLNYLKSHLKHGIAEYPNNQHCVWIIKAPPSLRIRIGLSSIALENHNSCEYDYLSITYKLGTNYTLWRKICGEQRSDHFTSPENEVIVTFHTDTSNSYRGFLMSYQLQ